MREGRVPRFWIDEDGCPIWRSDPLSSMGQEERGRIGDETSEETGECMGEEGGDVPLRGHVKDRLWKRVRTPAIVTSLG